MRRSLLLAVALLAALSSIAVAAVEPTNTSWARAEIRLVVGRGLMARDAESFRPDEVLTRAELEELAAGLEGIQADGTDGTDRTTGPETGADAGPGPGAAPGTPVPQPARGTEPVTMAALDARLVRALELQGAAVAFARSARAAGLRPPGRFGTEVVARLLRLRKNHPAAQDRLERLPNEPAMRAEAAYSAARVLRFRGWETDAVRGAAETFALPVLDPWQRRILQTAFGLVGYPYVWGGESEALERGFDCSGLVWRVYKLQAYTGAPRLAETLRGRTTYLMSGEFPRSQRIRFDDLAPGDLVFFGAGGPRSKPAQVDHMGIYVGSGWMVHSSRDGVTLTALEGWYRDRFAWGRRPLAEAGLAAKNPLQKP